MRRQVTGVVLTTLVLSLSASTGASLQDAYATSVEAWRAEREARLTADDGWLTVAGLFFLREGENSFGASPLRDIVLPEGPEKAGVFELRGRQVTLRAAEGRTLTVNGESVSSARLYPRDERADLTIGDLTMYVHVSGERLAIRLRDKNSAIRQNFTGLRWYPVNESYRVRARFVPHSAPVTVQVPNILGDIETFTSSGSVTLSLEGRELSLLPVDDDGELWFIFRDLTSGTETYPAARFLYAEAPKDGWTILDFNTAYNPPCAFNPHTTLPAPPAREPTPSTARGRRAGLPRQPLASSACHLVSRGRTLNGSRRWPTSISRKTKPNCSRGS